MTGFRHLGDTDVHQGHVWKVVVADFEAPDGERFRRDIVRSPGAVGVVPLVFDAEGQPSVVLVAQYRPPYERDRDRDPGRHARRAGRAARGDGTPRARSRRPASRPASMVHLIDMYPSPGMTDSVCSIFLATGCTPVAHDRHGPEEEEMELLHVPLDDALAMIDRGEIVDAKTVVGLLLTHRRLGVIADGRPRRAPARGRRSSWSGCRPSAAVPATRSQAYRRDLRDYHRWLGAHGADRR